MSTLNRWLAALPVFNEERYLTEVLTEVGRYAKNILVVNDGSTDGTANLLKSWPDIHVVHHPDNMGYGAALRTAFQFAIEHDYDCLVTLDCDGQHQPKRIPRFVSACENADIVSGSRYLKKYDGDSTPPSGRLLINRTITKEVNDLLGLSLTDTFCGFKAYRVESLKLLDISETGYAMPLELWVQAALRGLRIIEIPVPLIYLDFNRSFGGALDDGQTRLQHYRECISRSLSSMSEKGFSLSQPTPLRQHCFE